MTGFLLILLLVIFVVIGLAFLAIGLSVILTKRPVILSGLWPRAVMLLALVPIFLRVFVNEGKMPFVLGLLPALVWGLLVVMIWRQASGYKIIGIANPAFRESLIATLSSMNVAFQEDITGITIPADNVHLEMNILSYGAGTIRVRDKNHAVWLTKLANALGRYYKSTPVETTLTFSILYSVLGAFMLMGLAVPLFYRDSANLTEKAMSKMSPATFEQKEFPRDYITWLTQHCIDNQLKGKFTKFNRDQVVAYCTCFEEQRVQRFTMEEEMTAERARWSATVVPEAAKKYVAIESDCTKKAFEDRGE